MLAPLASQPAETPPPANGPGEARADGAGVHALRIDMQMLMWKVDQLHKAAEPGERMAQAADEISAAARALPQQLQDAVMGALEMQRRAMVKTFAEVERKILVDIAELQGKLRPEAPSSAEPPASVAELDARFQWLVDAVSDRFVKLGNELVRIERQFVDGHDVNAGHDGSGNGAKGNGAVANGSSSASSSNGAGVPAPMVDKAR